MIGDRIKGEDLQCGEKRVKSPAVVGGGPGGGGGNRKGGPRLSCRGNRGRPSSAESSESDRRRPAGRTLP